jgi:hypothetical protein
MRYSPWVTTPHRPDTRSLDNILSFPAIAGRKGEELAIAIWKYCIDKDYGFYHFWTPEEKTIDDEKSPGGVRDPLTLINCYGSFLCGTAALVESCLWKYAGLGGRQVGLAGHVVSEAFYDGGWHLLDADLQAFHRHHPPRETSIASCADCIEDTTIVSQQKNPSEPYYIPDRAPDKMADGCYKPGNLTYYPRYLKELHTMDYLLRPGEEMVRYYEQQGRWFCPPSWIADSEKYKTEWNNEGPRERFVPHRRYGNGCLRYHPDMKTDNLLKGALSEEGFVPGDEGLCAELDTAVIDIPVFSPYVIVGKRDNWKETHESHDGAYVSLVTSGKAEIRVSVSTDDGAFFRDIDVHTKRGKKGTTHTADFTPLVENYYRYILRVEMKGEGTVLTGFDLTTWFEVNPGTLPTLKAGLNPVTVESGNNGIVPCVVRLTKRIDEFMVTYRGERVDEETVTIKAGKDGVEAVLRLAPPYGTVSGAYVFASFHPAPPDANFYEVTYEWSASEDGPWHEFFRAEVPHEIEGQGHWPWGEGAYFSCGEEPLSEVFVRLKSPFDLWEVETRFDLADVLSVVEEPSEIKVDFSMRAGESKRTETVTLPAGETKAESVIKLAEDPVMESVRMYIEG